VGGLGDDFTNWWNTRNDELFGPRQGDPMTNFYGGEPLDAPSNLDDAATFGESITFGDLEDAWDDVVPDAAPGLAATLALITAVAGVVVVGIIVVDVAEVVGVLERL
jgi:hypothetical protein